MRGWLSTVLAAVIGGAVTAAALLGAGAVDDGDAARRPSAPLAGRATPALAAPPAAGSARARSTSATRRASSSCARRRCAPTRRRSTSSTRRSRREATGSGFVIDEDGLILTNAHVVAAATDIHVTFSDAHTVTAKPVGKDPDTDLALLRVDPDGLDLRAARAGRLRRPCRSATRRSRSATRSGSSGR